MQITLTSLIRLTVLTALAASCAAIGVSRLAPPIRPWRIPCQVEYAGVNEFFLSAGGQGVRWVARNGEGTIHLPYSPAERFDYAACSPWHDEQGRSQVAGRWSRGMKSSEGELGIARLSFPDGEVLDHVVTKSIPLGAPCWYPGLSARILFASGDGRLYNHAFESPEIARGEPSISPLSGPDALPRPIPILCESLENHDVFISDPHWPTDSRFSRTIFVSLRSTLTTVPRPAFNSCAIWWLRLSEDGRAIEDGGRLLDVSKESGDLDVEERSPIVGRTPEGELTLAYLRKVSDQPCELRAVPIKFDVKARRPVAEPGPGVRVTVDCQPCQPTFTTDGKHILFVGVGSGTLGELRRVAVDVRGARAQVAAAH